MRSVLCALALLASATGFYLPGVTPKTFAKGEAVKIRVNRLTSTETFLPYDYYDLPFPEPEAGVKEMPENLGEYLTANRIENSPYKVKMMVDQNCQLLARQETTKEGMAKFRQFIKDGYHINWIMDNLPSAGAIDDEESKTQTTVYDIGFPLGLKRVHKGKYIGTQLNNHVKIVVSYHPTATGTGGRIVGFLVEPISVKHTFNGQWNDKLGASQLTSCYRGRSMPSLDSRRSPMFIDEEHDPHHIVWTYDVMWRRSKIQWASRWDTYLSMAGRYDDEVHWFSIINALLIVFFLTGMVALIMVRSLHRDITRYNAVPTQEERDEERDESGWKLVHADVFRAPSSWPMLFCIFIGTGAQLFAMATVTLIFAAIGFLSPANRGSLMMALLMLFVLMGVLAGYMSARTYKMFNGKFWQKTTILTATLFPGGSFLIFFVLNLFCWAEGSVRAVPFGSMFAMVALWFGISVPLVFLGAYLGYRKDTYAFPIATSAIPRKVPEQQWYLQTWFVVAIGGILPFGAVFVELFFIMSSIWLNQFYYVFGFLLLVFTILVVTCAEITVVLCYFQLCAEDYNWWWRSFLTSGASGIYVFVYGIFYFFTKLDAHYLTTAALYFGYMGIISFGFFLVTGIVGYLSCFYFNTRIYASIKVD